VERLIAIGADDQQAIPANSLVQKTNRVRNDSFWKVLEDF